MSKPMVRGTTGASVGAAVGAAVSTTTGACVGAAVGAAVGVVQADNTSTEMIKILPRIHARFANIFSSPYIDTIGLENQCSGSEASEQFLDLLHLLSKTLAKIQWMGNMVYLL
jgi:gas vesicle protein